MSRAVARSSDLPALLAAAENGMPDALAAAASTDPETAALGREVVDLLADIIAECRQKETAS